MMPISEFSKTHNNSDQKRLKQVVREYFRTLTDTDICRGHSSASFLAETLAGEEALSGAVSGEDTVNSGSLTYHARSPQDTSNSYYNRWRSFDSPMYSCDLWPTGWTEEQVKQHTRYYKAMPEEFYTTSQFPVVTASNVLAWCKHMGDDTVIHVRECFSGSGRLSLCGHNKHLSVAPPLDYRYGFDLGCMQHQKMTDNSIVDYALVSWYAPKCTHWSPSCWRAGKDTIEAKRKDEEPTLHWIASKFKVAESDKYHRHI